MTVRKLTPQESGQLGGLRSAGNMTPEQRKERAEKGGRARFEKYGREGMVRMRLARHGWTSANAAPARPAQRPRVNGANESSQEGK